MSDRLLVGCVNAAQRSVTHQIDRFFRDMGDRSGGAYRAYDQRQERFLALFSG